MTVYINPIVTAAREGGPTHARMRKFSQAEPLCLAGVPTVGGAWGSLPAAVFPQVTTAYSAWQSDWINCDGHASGTVYFVVKACDATTFKAMVETSDDPNAVVRTAPVADDATAVAVNSQAHNVAADSSGTSQTAPTEQEFTSANYQPNTGKGHAQMQLDLSKGIRYFRISLKRGTGGTSAGTTIGAKWVGGIE